MKPLIIITGASSGIGAATARLFSQNGHPLLLLARRLEKIQALDLPQALCRKVDVTDYEALCRAVAEAEQKFGEADAIVNNAGVMLLGDIATQDPKEWKQMFDVNILGLLNGMQAVLPGMRARRGGTIINISSVAGRKTFPNHGAYCGTKFGVHAITENAREESASHNVRMVTIAPGAVETEFSNVRFKGDQDRAKKVYEGYRPLVAEDIAECIFFCVNAPDHVQIADMTIFPSAQSDATTIHRRLV